MKRFTTIVALVLMVAMPMMAKRVSPETAQKVATTFLNNNGAKAAQLTDLSKAAGFPNLYIFTTENSFVVMAADDCAQPILGYSLSDKFIVDDMPENLRWWLQQYSDEIQWGIENGIQSDKSTADEWQDLKEGKRSKDTPTTVVEPLLTTKWDQGSPYNMYCPTGTVTGCVATAMAQVMKYWNYPKQGQGSHSYIPEKHPEYGEQSVNFGEATYDWDNMTDTYNSTSTDTQKQAVATLMYHCGVSVNMNYATSSEGGSGAVSSTVPDALVEYFKYAPSATYKYKNDFTNDQWIALLQSELDEHRPIFYAGRYEYKVNNETKTGGHAFVCDGYRSDNYFHFNWGWSGSDGNGTDNGYWPIGALNPQSNGIGSGHGTYNLNNGAAFWVEPLSNLAAPILSATIANGTISLEWEAIAEADSYDLYRDNIKIASNITENCYTDNSVVSGIYYEYYVRSVSGSTRSNPSNRVTKLTFFRDYTPDNLKASLTTNVANLTWNEPQNNTATLQYSITYYSRTGFGAGIDTYWAEVFDPSRLTSFVGMYINKVSTYLYVTGNYKLIIYEGDPFEETSNKLIEKEFTNTTANAWKDIEIENPFTFDHTKELWVIIFLSGSVNSSESYPAPCGNYNNIPINDETNPERFNPRRIGKSLDDQESWDFIGGDYSWLMRTYLTDGTYTYNIYDGETKLNSETITGSSYTHENPADNTVHNYIVTTNYYGGESEASNTASLALGTVSIENLALEDNDQMTVTQNSTLTVTGALSNDNPENLILENGAQLFHSGSDVYATVKKGIAAYTTEKNGWNFIASPIATQLETATIDGLIPENEETTFDLYKYNEPNHKWYNYKPKTDNAEPGFAIDPKTGYLYASSENTTLSFAGKLHSASSVSSNTLSYSADVLKGFNLVGNPLPFNAYVSKSYYKMNDERTNIKAVTSNSETVAPCTGIIVEATGENESVVFSQTPMPWSNRGQLQIAVAENKLDRDGSSTSAMQVDNAIISFNEADPLQKFVFNEDNAKLYIPQGDEDFAIACANNQNEMPLNFKPTQDGTFTLTVQPESVKMGYLFLIDNMTGTHINLLTTPNYTFEAKTDDYESRFKLLFATANEETETFENESFGFIINGQFQSIIGQGLLQVIDLNGRILKSANEMDCIGLDGLTAGVYVIRFITANSVRTQKIVVE